MVFSLNYPIIISFVEKPPSLDDLHFQKRLYVIRIIQDQAKKQHDLLPQFWNLKSQNFSPILTFMYSEKATKFWEISTLLLSYVVPVKSSQK